MGPGGTKAEVVVRLIWRNAGTIVVVNLLVFQVELEKGLCWPGYGVQGAVPAYNGEAYGRAGGYECAGGGSRCAV